MKSGRIKKNSFEWLDSKLADVAELFEGVSQTKENPGRKFRVAKMKDTGDFVSGTFEWIEDESEKEEDYDATVQSPQCEEKSPSREEV